jgi:NifB/MoaA-like Fe-S oxidoreductase
MFAPILQRLVDEFNSSSGADLHVVAVPNDYFGGDVSVAGLMSGADILAVRDRIKGDFAVMPSAAVKSDEPVLIDGMGFDDLRRQFPVGLAAMTTVELIEFLSNVADI